MVLLDPLPLLLFRVSNQSFLCCHLHMSFSDFDNLIIIIIIITVFLWE
jgi:hypothetical protein